MQWDYIVVGTGSAGCAVADQLICAGAKVLVLEAGGSDRSPFIKIPAGIRHMPARFDWGYRAQPDASRGGVIERWRRGRALGGTSCINGMVYVRGAPGDFDRWSQNCGNQGGWSARDVMPIFRNFEQSDQIGPLRGQMGQLYTRTIKRPHILTDAFIESTCATGVPFNHDYNGDTQGGVSYVQYTQRRGLRWTTADAFLKPHLGKANFKLLLKATVEKIDIANERAVAVVFRHRGKLHRETAHDIVLSAGAINSPKLLMLSGIGDRDDLRRHNIDVVHDLPDVGRHLKEHPYTKLIYRTKIPSYNLTEGIFQKLAIGAKYLRFHEGPIAAIYEAAAFLKLFASSKIPDVQIMFAPLGWGGEIGLGGQDALKLTPYPALKIAVIRSHSISSGRVRLSSGDPNAPPVIELQSLESEADVDVLVRGIQTVRSIMKTDPIMRLIKEEIAPGATLIDRSLRTYVRSHTELACHAMGTCRMGVGDDAVVGPDLRVRGMKNLWVADTSIMPDPISANLNAPAMMIGAKLGKQLVCR